MAKKKFIKYAFEDIRTEYLPFDSEHVAPGATIEARTPVEFYGSSSSGSIAAYELVEADSSSSIDNSTVFLPAEDVKPGDYGMVYYIIENNGNLE